MSYRIYDKFTSQGIPLDFLAEVAKGRVPGYSLVQKFGAGLLTTTLKPIAQSGIYKTPSSATALEYVGAATDTALGAGAREITLQGLDEDWEEVTQVIATNGTTAVPIPIPLTRLYRWYVSKSGTYATMSTGSHVGIQTIREAGAGATWSTIPITPFPIGQSQIGVYTVPKGKVAYLLSKHIFTDTSKTADIYFFQRTNADISTAPFSPMRLVEREVGVQGGYALEFMAPKGPFIGPCDIGFMGKVSLTSADCSVEFELLIIDVG